MTYTPTEQANIDAMYRFMEAEAVQDWDTVYQFIAPDCVNYSPTGVVRGHEEMHRFDAAMFAGLQSWRGPSSTSWPTATPSCSAGVPKRGCGLRGSRRCGRP
ncbi:MAG: nuclear transport factor 2 family protein [Dehalococcoidia bacterium]|uniref:nuclear transport factor 2 family protein n=1 Tax=Candidatus Amarobacter glycogenicus TaxID=3140699 RepID=UPI0031365B5B|nr:nuclear transport factor 2 family protein [Dehalococcoidia bacterium]